MAGGHIRKRGDKWCFVVDLGYDEDNKRKQKWYSGFKTKKEAQGKLTEILQTINTGQFVENTNATLNDFLFRWLNDYASINVSHNTFESYKYVVCNHLIPKFGKIKVINLKAANIQKFYSDTVKNTDLSTTTVLYIHKIFKQALNHAVKWQLIHSNPCALVDPPRKSNQEANYLQEEELFKLLDHCYGKPIHIPVFLATTTGMRRGEILGLRWKDIDLDDGMIYVSNNLQLVNKELKLTATKTEKSKRPVKMNKTTITYLRRQKIMQAKNRLMLGEEYKDMDFVCCWDHGVPFRPDYITQTFSRIIKKLEITKISFHDLRHTHATLLLKEGIHPKIVSERLGHSKVSITLDTYSHVIPDMQTEAAEKIEEMLFKKVT